MGTKWRIKSCSYGDCRMNHAAIYKLYPQVRSTVDETAYDDLLETNNTYNLPTGIVDVTITKQEISYYDYENNLNEDNENKKVRSEESFNKLLEELKVSKESKESKLSFSSFSSFSLFSSFFSIIS